MAEAPPKPEADKAPKKKLPLKTLAIFASVMLLEGGVIATVFMLSGQPAQVKGESAADLVAQQGEKPVELMVIEDRFQNTKTGRTYLYQTEVYVVVKQKHKDVLSKRIEAMQAQIKDEIGLIIRRAEPAHLLEPTLATLKRQVNAKLDELLGPDEAGNSRLEKVLIPKVTQYRADP